MSYYISANNKRITKNTLLLYLRMCITMLVGLYTSRVILKVLGVQDYGIYGVVGGVVIFMGFLNASMSGATSRFLTYELGRGDKVKLNDTFVSAFWVHIIIALAVVAIAESAGLWFLYNKLVIPEGRMNAAFWAFQFSIFAAVVSITQVPYNASVISHEDMNIYAYVEIGNAFLKLGVVYLLTALPTDKLISYAALYFSISFGIALYYRYFCITHYLETRLTISWNKQIVKTMLYYCAWDLYGNFSGSVKYQGRTFLINMFFGVALNAAASIANIVVGMVMGFTNSVIQAFSPQITKKYANGDINDMLIIGINATKYSLLLMALMSVPLIIEMDYILGVWLEIVPDYASVFCKLIIISSFIYAGTCVPNTIIHATGNIKRLSFISGSYFLLTVPLTYICYKCGLSSTATFYIDIICNMVILITNLSIVKHNVPSISLGLFYKGILSVILAIIPGFIIGFYISYNMNQSFVRLTIVSASFYLTTLLISYFLIFDKSVRGVLHFYVKRLFSNIR